MVARALTLAADTLALDSIPLSDWADRHRPDRFETRALRAYTAPSRSYATQSAAGLAAVRGVSAKAAYLRALLLADPEHVGDHDGSYRHRLERALRAFASARRAG